MGTSKSTFVAHYDKIIALVCVLLCGASFYFWFSTKQSVQSEREEYNRGLMSLKPKTAVMDMSSSQQEFVQISNAFSRVDRPYKMALDPKMKAGFFVPETRVWCAHNSCKAPIPFDAKVCPRCQTEQPVKGGEKVDPTLDSDGDGIPDQWETANGLNPYDPADAALDFDEDGFTNLEEYLAKTDPRDPKSHTDHMDLLVVRSIDVTKLPVRFETTQTLPGGKYKCTFNYIDAELGNKMKTLNLKEGDRFGPLDPLPGSGIKAEKRYADFILEKIDWREEDVYNRVRKEMRKEKVSVAIVKRVSTGRLIEFRKGEEATDTDYRITLIQTHNGEEYVAIGSEGEAEFTIEDKVYQLKKVDKSSKSVVIVSAKNQKEFSIPAEKETSSSEFESLQ